MTEKLKFQDEVFIARWVAGELTKKETNDFNKWIKSNPKKKKYFEEIKSTWQCPDKIKLKKGLSKEERWNRINKVLKINSNGKTTN